jgi:ABC-type polysaccharide/polyol phosphate transport system ATPase subunit
VSGEPVIQVHDLRKTFQIPHDERTTFKELFLHPLRRTSYETNRAVDGVTFSVARGEFFGVIGANGSGKSTLLKLLAQIYRPDSGTLSVRGRISPFIELGVGFNMDLTARDNIRINGTLLGLTRKQLAERFDDILAFAELERFVDQRLRNFSSGMQLRLAYSIAIQVPFDVLLLDEVLAVGDQSFQEKCFATFEEIRAVGKTTVFVSHDLSTVRKYCDRVLLLEHGRARALGPAEDVVEQYAGAEALVDR